MMRPSTFRSCWTESSPAAPRSREFETRSNKGDNHTAGGSLGVCSAAGTCLRLRRCSLASRCISSSRPLPAGDVSAEGGVCKCMGALVPSPWADMSVGGMKARDQRAGESPHLRPTGVVVPVVHRRSCSVVLPALFTSRDTTPTGESRTYISRIFSIRTPVQEFYYRRKILSSWTEEMPLEMRALRQLVVLRVTVTVDEQLLNTEY